MIVWIYKIGTVLLVFGGILLGSYIVSRAITDSQGLKRLGRYCASLLFLAVITTLTIALSMKAWGIVN